MLSVAIFAMRSLDFLDWMGKSKRLQCYPALISSGADASPDGSNQILCTKTAPIVEGGWYIVSVDI
jgi:hypothetical protein